MKRTLAIVFIALSAIAASAQQAPPPKSAEPTVEQLKLALAEAHLTIAHLREQVIQTQNSLTDVQKQALSCIDEKVKGDEASAQAEIDSLKPKKDDKKPSAPAPQKKQ